MVWQLTKYIKQQHHECRGSGRGDVGSGWAGRGGAGRARGAGTAVSVVPPSSENHDSVGLQVTFHSFARLLCFLQ